MIQHLSWDLWLCFIVSPLIYFVVILRPRVWPARAEIVKSIFSYSEPWFSKTTAKTSSNQKELIKTVCLLLGDTNVCTSRGWRHLLDVPGNTEMMLFSKSSSSCRQTTYSSSCECFVKIETHHGKLSTSFFFGEMSVFSPSQYPLLSADWPISKDKR